MAKIETKIWWNIRKEIIYDLKKFNSTFDYSTCMEIINMGRFFGTYLEAKAEEKRLLKEAGNPPNTLFYASVFETKEIRIEPKEIQPKKKKKKKEVA